MKNELIQFISNNPVKNPEALRIVRNTAGLLRLNESWKREVTDFIESLRYDLQEPTALRLFASLLENKAAQPTGLLYIDTAIIYYCIRAKEQRRPDDDYREQLNRHGHFN